MEARYQNNGSMLNGLQPSKTLGAMWPVTTDTRVMKRWRAGKRCTCVMKCIETGQYHLSAGYIFALRVVANLPHNRVLLPSVALLLD
jgi:hypothetical protein